MDYITILAQTSETAAAQNGAQIVPLDFIYEQITSLSWFQALITVSFGAVYLMYGWRIFKALTVISFALLGLYAGMWVGGQFDKVFLGSIIGLGLLALLSIPLMRWAVSILGAVAGGILTAGLWYACKLPEQYIWAGGLVGVVAGGMISFIVFRIAVMLFTSLGGGALIVTGLLALLYQYDRIQEAPTENVKQMLYNHNWFMPVLLLASTAIGIILQNKLIKGSKDWSL
ncbi:MAG: hypothetical protein DRP62_06900 [Planctomycetota bacterium]|nr:MAG: hypothetical protein DRP62_06900 [Planctomycetota bacterium]